MDPYRILYKVPGIIIGAGFMPVPCKEAHELVEPLGINQLERRIRYIFRCTLPDTQTLNRFAFYRLAFLTVSQHHTIWDARTKAK